MPQSKYLLAALFALLAGCGKHDASQRAVARLDDRTLTLDEVRARLDSSRGLTAAQVSEYAHRWMNDEILYREALRRGLDKSDNVRTQIDEARRQILINALLQEEVYTSSSMESNAGDVAAYYADHAKEFVLPADVALVSYVLFRDRDAANAFRAAVLKGTSWVTALQEGIIDPQQGPAIMTRVDSAYYTQSTLLPVELWRVASAATKPEPSFPIKTTEGSYVLIVWKYSRQGQVPDLAYCESEIRSRLTIERRRRAMEKLMESLRSNHAVEFMSGS